MNAGKFHPRSDPFAMSPEEKSFDYSQASERVFNEIGGFPSYVQAEEEVTPEVATETQPYRRLAGVVVGDSVVAIIDMGGNDIQLIRPGMKVPNHEEWTVVSIDQDRAILRRGGEILPKQIEVRLESPPAEYAPQITTPPPAGGGGGGPMFGAPPQGGRGVGGGGGGGGGGAGGD
jgi:hypothetical protein